MNAVFGTLLWILASLWLGPAHRHQAESAYAERATAASYEGSAQAVGGEASGEDDWSPFSWFSTSDPGEPISNGF